MTYSADEALEKCGQMVIHKLDVLISANSRKKAMNAPAYFQKKGPNQSTKGTAGEVWRLKRMEREMGAYAICILENWLSKSLQLFALEARHL